MRPGMPAQHSSLAPGGEIGRLRTVLLCADYQSTRIMYHGLAAVSEVVAVIQEERPPARQILLRRARKLGWGTVAGQVLFILWNRLLARRDQQRCAELVRRFGLCDAPIPEALLHRVASVNAPETQDLLQALQPQAVVVNGTRIIGEALLAAVAAPFLNTHMGITPRYRGVHGGYWALTQDDAAHCGVTVHLVDRGIDTGAVLYQARIHPEPQDSINTYPVLQMAAAVPLMQQALADLGQGGLTPRPGVPPSRLWSHPTLLQYLRFRFTKGVR